MNELQERILSVFLTRNIEQLGADFETYVAGGINNYDEIRKDDDFKTALRTIVEPFRSIESIAQEAEAINQVARVLDLLWEARRRRKEDRITILLELADKHLAPAWGADENLLKEYKWRSEVVTKWKDYFLSYTLRQAVETNNQFRPLIEETYPKFPEADEVGEENYVANIIHRFFRRIGLRGFYDREGGIAIGERIGEAVKTCCRQSFAFVQLVEGESLNPPDFPPNWCHLEWQEFSKNELLQTLLGDRAGNVRMFFVTKDEFEEPVDPYPDYEDWIEDVRERLHKRFADSNASAVEKKVRDVAKQIKKLRDDAVAEALTVI